tara:strand:+ start:21713 stop:22771 length:1059 start_codon:yes stop_codon:yes gene_type:complete
MKKILFFTDAFSGGGAEEVMLTFSNQLKSYFDIIHVVKWLGPKKIELKSNMINLDKKSSISCLPLLYSICKKEKPDIIFSSTAHNNIIALILKLLFFRKLKVIIRESSVASIMKKYSLKSIILDFFLVSLMYRMADVIIAQSNDMYNDLVNNYNFQSQKVQIINNPIEKCGLLKSSKSVKNNIWLLTIGRFSKEKGFDRLVQVMYELPKKYNLIILGDGVLFENTKNKLKELGLDKRVFCLGFMEEQNKINIIKNSDLYIQTSYVEGFPNSLLQSLCMGLPAVAFDVPGGTKEIINKLNGVLIQDGNISKMVEEIIKFDFHKYNPEEMKKNILDRFDTNKIIDKLFNIINEI